MDEKVCSCGNKTFRVIAIERHDWLVDGTGGYIEDVECYQSQIADFSEWECAECGEIYGATLGYIVRGYNA